GEDGERGVGEELTGLRAQDDVVRTDREVRRHRPRGVEGPGDVGGGDRGARRGGEQQRRGGEPAGRDVDPHRVEALPGVVEATEGGLALRGEGGGGAGGLHLSRRHAEGRAVEGGQDGAGVLGELADRAVRARELPGGDVGDEDRRVHRELDAEVGEVDLQRRGAVVLVPLEGDGAGEAQHREVGGDLGDRETEGAVLGLRHLLARGDRAGGDRAGDV